MKVSLLLFIAALQQDVLVVPGDREEVPIAYLEYVPELDGHHVPHVQMEVMDALAELGYTVRSVDLKVRTEGRWLSVRDLLEPEVPPEPRMYEVKTSSGTAPVTHLGPAGEVGGALFGKTVYVSAGHGWYWSSTLGRWATQRGTTNGIVEDFVGTEAISHYFIPMLLNAGATVFPVKEPDMNSNMVVVDDVDAILEGQWLAGEGTGYADGWVMIPSGTNPFELGGYIFTGANDEVTARARFTAELPAAGSYGVHISWSAGVDRAEDVLVEVHHAGGVDKILVDQKNHGGTWVYLGSFDFQMTGGEVVITNQSTSVGQIVTADAVRFGGGVGLIERGTGDYPAAGQTTGRPRFESCARYHAQFCGAPDTVYDNSSEDSKDDVGARSRYAAWQHPDGEDAVFVSWHSNAPNPGTGTSTWVYGPDGPGSPYEFTGTAGSEQLAQAVHAQFINSIRDAWDVDWKDRGVRSAWFGELSPYSNPEMPSVLVETAFHDTPSDAALLLEPHFRFTLARAYLKGLIDYFAARDGVVAMYPPLAPEDLVVQGLPDGDIRVQWSPVTDATSYRIWTSEDGVGFRFEKEVNTSDAELSAEHHVSLAVRVTAVSEAGESFPSTTLSVMPACTEERALLVSGFERLDGFSVPKEDMSAWYLNTPYRFDQKRMNTYDYSIRHGDALSALGIPYDSIEASALVQGTFDLSKYTFIDWILGEESTVDETLSTVEQTLVTEYIAQGGKAFFSGSEIAWDLHFKGSDTDRQFCEQVLGIAFAADDAQTYTLSSGASFTALYDVEYADTFNVVSGEAVWFYDTGAVAGVVNNSVFIAGFPWETVADTADRVSLYAEVIDRLDVPSIPGVDTCDVASQPADDTTACRAGDAECDISVGSDVHVEGIDTDERDAHFIAQDTGKFVDASVRTNPGVPNPDPSCTHLGGITRSSTTLLMLLCALGLLLLGRTTRRGPR